MHQCEHDAAAGALLEISTQQKSEPAVKVSAFRQVPKAAASELSSMATLSWLQIPAGISSGCCFPVGENTASCWKNTGGALAASELQASPFMNLLPCLVLKGVSSLQPVRFSQVCVNKIKFPGGAKLQLSVLWLLFSSQLGLVSVS